MCQNCNQNNCGGCTETTTLCNQCQSEQATCDCPILGLSTDCSTFNQDDIVCGATTVVAKNTILSDALSDIVSWACIKFDELANYLRLRNVGTGVEIYAGDNLIGEKKIRTLTDSSLINLTENTNDINISVDEAALNTFIEANQKTYSVSNIGTGAQVYKDSTVVGDNTQLNLRKIKSSNSSVNITEGTNDIDITVSAAVIPDGSETKVTAGDNVSVTGTGTIATPYVVNSTDTTYSAGTAISLVGTTFNNTAPDQVVALTQGGLTTVTGTYPNFTISSTGASINSGVTTIVSGAGTIGSPYVIEIQNLQKVITYPADFTGTNYTLTNADNNYEIIVDNGATAISITVPSGLVSKIGVGFTQKGSGDVSYVASGTTINNPTGLKIKGQYYQTFLSQELATNSYYLGGNTKV